MSFWIGALVALLGICSLLAIMNMGRVMSGRARYNSAYAPVFDVLTVVVCVGIIFAVLS